MTFWEYCDKNWWAVALAMLMLEGSVAMVTRAYVDRNRYRR